MPPPKKLWATESIRSRERLPMEGDRVPARPGPVRLRAMTQAERGSQETPCQLQWWTEEFQSERREEKEREFLKWRRKVVSLMVEVRGCD